MPLIDSSITADSSNADALIDKNADSNAPAGTSNLVEFPIKTVVGNEVGLQTVVGNETAEDPVQTIIGNDISPGSKTSDAGIQTIPGNETAEDPIQTVVGDQTAEDPIQTVVGDQTAAAPPPAQDKDEALPPLPEPDPTHAKFDDVADVEQPEGDNSTAIIAGLGIVGAIAGLWFASKKGWI